MGNFEFWRRWLVVVAAATVGFGLVLALLFGTAATSFLQGQANLVFWPNGEIDAGTAAYQHWIHGVLGATIAGFGVFLVALAHGPFRRREPWARNTIVAAVTLWFVVDSTISGIYGVWVNAALNLGLYLPLMLPMIMTRRDFVAEASRRSADVE